MIEISPTLKSDYPRAFELARQDKFRIVWLEDDLVYCARRKRGHGQYLIRFFFVRGIDREVKVRMRCDSTTGGRCKGTEFGEEPMCAHMAAVCLRGIPKGRAKAEQRAA